MGFREEPSAAVGRRMIFCNLLLFFVGLRFFGAKFGRTNKEKKTCFFFATCFVVLVSFAFGLPPRLEDMRDVKSFLPMLGMKEFSVNKYAQRVRPDTHTHIYIYT